MEDLQKSYLPIPGDRVDRVENRSVTGAVVIAVQDTESGTFVELGYDEGGSGWWPASCVTPVKNEESFTTF